MLVLLGLSAVLVLPALLPPSPATVNPLATVVSTARHLAVRRGEPVRLRIAADGAWAVVAMRDGAHIDGGRLRGAVANRSETNLSGIAGGRDGDVVADLSIDAMGSCYAETIRSGVTGFDPLTCQWTVPDVPERGP